MLKRTIILIIASAAFFNAEAAKLVVQGTYQGKNLYVDNPINSSGVGFSISKVLVNNEITSDEINSSAFIIDLGIYGFNTGNEITVEIIHQNDNPPLILNPESLQPKSTFEITDLKLDNQGTLEWSTVNENGSLPFVIEQYRWNKWIKLGEVLGNGSNEENTYTFQVDLNSGKNKVRIVQKDYTNEPRRSDIATTFKDSYAQVKFIHNVPKKSLVFNQDTRFEIYDEYGRVLKKGFGKRVDLSTIEDGSYYINFDNFYDLLEIN